MYVTWEPLDTAYPAAVTPASRAESAGPHAGRDHATDLVVLLALLGVAEHVVRGVDFLEALLGLGIAGVRVGVVLLRELLVGARQLLLRRARRHAEHGVVVLLEPLSLCCQRTDLPT